MAHLLLPVPDVVLFYGCIMLIVLYVCFVCLLVLYTLGQVSLEKEHFILTEICTQLNKG